MADFSNSGKRKNCNSHSAKNAKQIKMEKTQFDRRSRQEANRPAVHGKKVSGKNIAA